MHGTEWSACTQSKHEPPGKHSSDTPGAELPTQLLDVVALLFDACAWGLGFTVPFVLRSLRRMTIKKKTS